MRKLFIALALTASVAASAQIADDSNKFNHLSVGAGVGTNGISLELGTTLCPVVTMRAGVDIMPKFKINNSIDYDRPEVLNNVPAELLNERYVNIPEYGAHVDIKGTPGMTQGKLLFDIHPGKNSMFHFTVGAYFGGRNMVSAKALDKTIAAVELYNHDITTIGPDGIHTIVEPEDDPKYKDGIKIDLEGYNLTPNKGRIELDGRINAVRPYIGIGVGRTVPRKRVGCKFEFGAQFIGKIKVVDKYGDGGKGHVITADEPGISSDFKDVIDILNKIPVYPTLKLTIFGRIF